jgi:hypothetical protein
MIQYATYRCVHCEREWDDELTPLWMGYDIWPTCCLNYALLVAEQPEPSPELVARSHEDDD